MAAFCTTCFTISFFVILAISLILFSLSFKVLDLNHYALKRNTYNRNVDKSIVYKPGRYFTGLTGEFIKYSSKWQYISFFQSGGDSGAISGKSGTDQITLEVVLVYRLKAEFLKDLYKDYPSLNHKRDMISAAKEQILEIIPQYPYTDFFTKRHEIVNKMSQAINKKFKDTFFAELTLFLLEEVILEQRFEDKIITQLIKQQEILTQEKLNEIKKLEGDLSVIESETKKEVQDIILVAETTANQQIQDKKAEGDILLLNAEGVAYQTFKGVIPAAWTADQIIQFTKWKMQFTSQNVNLYMGVHANGMIEI